MRRTRSEEHPSRIVARLDDAWKFYGELAALQGLELELRAGEVLGLLGPNGAGKTTTVNLLLGLARPSQGTVRVFGLDPHQPRSRMRVGAMLQIAAVPHTLHVRLMAPLAFKVKIIMENLGMNEEEAKAHIQARQSERNEFIKHFTGMDLSNPHLYHLIINNEKFSIDEMADIITDRVKRMQA